MTRAQLAHILRSAAKIANDPRILVVGSQAILASFSEDELPEAAWRSIEADVAFFDERDGQRKADEVDGAIGELSQFHQTYSYYGQGVDLMTAKLPDGWRDRLVPFRRRDADPALALCLEKHDLIISKLVAMREKDQEFAIALLHANMVEIDVLLARVAILSCVAAPIRRRIREWLESAQRKLPDADSTG